jgi:hypothetical protein
MADHRVVRERLRFRQLLHPTPAQGLRANVIASRITSALAWTGVAVFLTAVGAPVLGVSLLAFGVLDMWMVYRAAVRWRQEFDASGQLVQDSLDHLASNPGGAPMVAELTAHCGCTHRWAYGRDEKRWLEVGIVSSSDTCFVEAR